MLKFQVSGSKRTTAEEAVRAAVQRLYCELPEEYLRYRGSGKATNEERAWLLVDAFVQNHQLNTSAIIDLGCGSGSPIMRGWDPKKYLGFDISVPLLEQHVLRGLPQVSLTAADLNQELAQEVEPPDGFPSLVLSVLALHYIAKPGPLISAVARPGRWFCLLVANAEHDRPYRGADGLTHLVQNGVQFTYFVHEIEEYVSWLNYPRLLHVQQCGYESSKEMHHPYYLIAGHW